MTPGHATPTLAPEIAARLDRLRPHTRDATPEQIATLVEQAFRNFPGADTATLVRLLATR